MARSFQGPTETHEEGHGTFGFGKRACVGKHIANESLFIYIATALWAVTLERARDEDGNEVPVDVDVLVDTGNDIKTSPIRVQYNCSVCWTAGGHGDGVGRMIESGEANGQLLDVGKMTGDDGAEGALVSSPSQFEAGGVVFSTFV
ncbi:hypothetical protein H4582DRAFT_2125229 [Lactarius indigo]|nr:hypothetical protein H4582DRAFT_2125229 [Lactarius indigo]